MEKPNLFEQALFTLLSGIFISEEELKIVCNTLLAKHITTVARLDRKSVTELMGMGIPEGLADEIVAARTPTSKRAAPQDTGSEHGMTGAVTGLTSTLQTLLGGKLEGLLLDKLLDRLIETGASDPTVVSFADEQHVLLAKRGVVLKPGVEKIIDREATLDYYKQPRSYLGDRWKNQRVVRVTEAFGVKEEFNPFNLDQPLQGGVDPNTDLDLTGTNSQTRNFFAFVGEIKPNLVKDDGHALVEATKEKGLEGLKAHNRFGKAVTAYEEACGDDPSTATKYLSRLYRTPGSESQSAGGRALPPFGGAGSTRTSKPTIDEITNALCEANDVLGGNNRTSIVFDKLGYRGHGGLPYRPVDDERGTTYAMVAYFYAQGEANIQRLVRAFFTHLVQCHPMHRAVDGLRAIIGRMEASSTTSNHNTPDRLAIYNRMCQLLEPQLGNVMSRLNIPSQYMPGSASPLATRAQAVLEFCDGPSGIGLSKLHETVEAVIRESRR